MRLGGRIQAAIEVLETIENHHQPASIALADWGRSHRFAGSADRAAIGNLVYDVLRNRSSIAWRMGNETARALALGTVKYIWDESLEDLKQLFAEDKFAPDQLSEVEEQALQQDDLSDAPGWIKANIPEWLEEAFQANFDEAYIEEGLALSTRPPTDLRINTLKANAAKVTKVLARFKPQQAPLTQNGVRLPASEKQARGANVLPEAAYQKGWFEVQDAGSQIVSELVFPQKGEQILDFCAGGGGKTLALSALMENTGQIHAYDANRERLAPIYDRLKRSGARNVQVYAPQESTLETLTGKMDRVVVDAPCSGSGVWRRRPDAKWRLSEKALSERQQEQADILRAAAQFVKPGGYLCYITCSLLVEENENQVYAFLEQTDTFELLSASEVWQDLYGDAALQPWSSDECSITLTPATTQTDGFFFAVMGRTS
ncbi:MAG: RsmB/NOP family class I SAM-dependent RNA methyltransferase [Pseudomonadota bacterium]